MLCPWAVLTWPSSLRSSQSVDVHPCLIYTPILMLKTPQTPVTDRWRSWCNSTWSSWQDSSSLYPWLNSQLVVRSTGQIHPNHITQALQSSQLFSTISRTRLLYSLPLSLYKFDASTLAGDDVFGSGSRLNRQSFCQYIDHISWRDGGPRCDILSSMSAETDLWILVKIAATSYVGLHLFCKMSRHNSPVAYTLGWNIWLINLTPGGLFGYCSSKCMIKRNVPSSKGVSEGPMMTAFLFMIMC